MDTPPPKTFAHLDYFSATYPYPLQAPNERHPVLPLPNDIFTVIGLEAGVKHYNRSAVMSPAGRLYWSDGERSKGCYAVFAGDGLALIRARLRLNDDQLLPRLMWNCVNVTRLDFAVNTAAGKPAQTRREFESGRAVTKVRTAWQPDYFAGGQGETIYFGSKSSTKMLRIYDKARELKLAADIILTRIELQVRKLPADKLARVMLRSGVSDTGKSAVRQFVDFPELAWYREALSGGHDVPMQLTPSKSSDFMRWLNDQVGPAIEKRLLAGEHTEDIRHWLEALSHITEDGQRYT